MSFRFRRFTLFSHLHIDLYVLCQTSFELAMLQVLALLIFSCAIFFSTTSLPSYRMIDAPAPIVAKRSTSLAASNNLLSTPALHLNTSTSTPTPSKAPIGYWPIVCGEEITPPGWVVPPEMHAVTNPTDCRDAIFRVTRGGDPLDPQIWTSRANWLYGSCGVFLTPGWSHTRVDFSRIDIAEIAQDIKRKCVTPEHDFMGGWVSLGGFFIILLTGTAVQL